MAEDSKILAQVRNRIRYKHYNYRTERLMFNGPSLAATTLARERSLNGRGMTRSALAVFPAVKELQSSQYPIEFRVEFRALFPIREVGHFLAADLVA